MAKLGNMENNKQQTRFTVDMMRDTAFLRVGRVPVKLLTATEDYSRYQIEAAGGNVSEVSAEDLWVL